MSTTQAEFRARLEALVGKFRANAAEYFSADYSEAQARHQFIDPLFAALGWDFEDRAGLGPARCEVWTEKGETPGKPDYNFRINAQTQFFAEAKAPHVKLSGPHILQAKRYAWNHADVSFAVLTDFEEFRLYDASLKPDPEHPDLGLIFAYRYGEYLTDAALADFYKLSRDEVAAGALDKLLKQDAASRRWRVPVDKAFLADLTDWREQLAKDAFKHDPGLSVSALNEAVQVFLDRLIFIRIAEDRRIIQADTLQKLVERWSEGRHRSLRAMLTSLFETINEDLNGEVFKPNAALDATAFDDALTAHIIHGLTDGPYDFAVIGVELLGSIYERYLGKTIRVTAKRAIVEDKPEVRKAGGVYYTPKYIVDYIVEQTVGKLVEGKTPAQIAKMRVLDPACGSGSFLLAAYQKLIDYHVAYYAGHPKEARQGELFPFLIDAGQTNQRLSIEKKAEILTNNIFGVDIDPQAVEITMMSLYIKALEGETTLPHKHGLLPTLASNIKCGNSLIGTDYVEGQLMPDAKELARVKPFDWESEFASSPALPRKAGEGAGGGQFDCVIGNPPYGASFGEAEAAYFHKNYQVFRGVKDVYTCFMEMSLARLKNGGRFSFIVPSAWLGGPEYENLRELLLPYQIETVILLPFDVFADAYVDTAIFAVSKHDASSAHKVQTHVYGKREKLASISLTEDDYKLIGQGEWRKTESKKFVLAPETVQILGRIRKRCTSVFGDVVEIKRGVLFDKEMLTKKRTSAISYRYFEGDVYRYQLNLVVDRWIEFSDQMKERPKEFIWFEGPRILLRRLVNRRQRLMATLASDTFITNKNLYSVLPTGESPNILVILSVLNSRLTSYLYINQVTQATKDDFPQVTIKDVLALPFPSMTDKARHDRLVSLVERMLELHKRLASARTSADREMYQRQIEATDRQIDALVYELYGLTEEEIKMVEGE